MAQIMSSIRVTDPSTKDLQPTERQDTGRPVIGDASPAINKLTVKLRHPTPSTPGNEQGGQKNGASSYTEGRRQSDEAIDPLSQQILSRTNTTPAVQRLKSQTDGSTAHLPNSPSDTHADVKQTPETVRDSAVVAGNKLEKKKGVSFLSRIIGTKKRTTLDGPPEDASEAGEARQEGMDAPLFTSSFDNLGFSPKYPQPPAYIKVRTKFKKEKEFNRLFLAQELRSSANRKSSLPGSNPAPQSGAAATHNPIWATEFSKDGKYLAAGGQDRIVRVWAVLSAPEERRAHEKEENYPSEETSEAAHLSAPVFQQNPFREYNGHTATILDLSWSKNNFLLSSSMDKTVRLWHISRTENLCTFKHTDFVPSIQFHPRDDRFFLAGSLDTKLRLWSIPDKSVAFWNQLPDMITAVSFTPDGKTCIAGTLSGLCMFYETEGLKYQTQIHVKSTRGQNAKGSKITGIKATHWPPGSGSGEVKLLISSNDSRIRLYNLRDKSLEMKFKGHENNCSQIRAMFADDSGHVICGSEDRKAYIWSTSAPEGEKRNQMPMETFEAHNSITTCVVMAPLKTRQLLSTSEDPIYDLCNPPPVTLVSRAESINSSRAPTDAGSGQQTPAANETTFKKAYETPAYIARSAHTDGNIMVTADYTGAIKVFRQDCAYLKRQRAVENWDNASVLSKRTGTKIGRPSSILSRGTGRARRDSTSTQPPDDRIRSWRQDISHSSFDSVNGSTPRNARSSSPRKSKRTSMSSFTRSTNSPSFGPTHSSTTETPSRRTSTPKTSSSIDRTPVQSQIHQVQQYQASFSKSPFQDQDITPNPSRTSSSSALEPAARRLPSASNPLAVYNGQSWAFWNNTSYTHKQYEQGLLKPRDAERPDLQTMESMRSTVSQLSSEASLEIEGEDSGDGIRCKHCGNENFKVRAIKNELGKEERKMVCGRCGMVAD